jgi:tRNA(fMet)-specific endonuclease VapC
VKRRALLTCSRPRSFAKFRATVAIDAETDDIMIASIAEALDFTLVTRRPGDFRRFPHLRVEDWTV